MRLKKKRIEAMTDLLQDKKHQVHTQCVPTRRFRCRRAYYLTLSQDSQCLANDYGLAQDP